MKNSVATVACISMLLAGTGIALIGDACQRLAATAEAAQKDVSEQLATVQKQLKTTNDNLVITEIGVQASIARISDSALALQRAVTIQATGVASDIHLVSASVSGLAVASAGAVQGAGATIQSAGADVHNTAIRAGILMDRSSDLVIEAGDQLDKSEFPKLVWDARRLTAITGTTMAHLDTTANVWAGAAPKFTANANEITADVSGYIHELTKKQPWWKKLESIGLLGVRIGAEVY